MQLSPQATMLQSALGKLSHDWEALRNDLVLVPLPIVVYYILRL